MTFFMLDEFQKFSLDFIKFTFSFFLATILRVLRFNNLFDSNRKVNVGRLIDQGIIAHFAELRRCCFKP